MTTQRLSWIGVAATLGIMTVLLIAALRESDRMNAAQTEQRTDAIQRGIDLYALNCAECHGSRGQGEITEDATELNDDYIRNRDWDYLYKSIARGLDNTDMAAFHLDEGSALNRQHIESLVTVIKYASWDDVAIRVAELGMVSDDELALADIDTVAEAAAELPVIIVVPTQIPVEDATPPTASITPQTATNPIPLPDIAIVPTEEASNEPLPSIAIVPTNEPDAALPSIVIMPTDTATDDTMPNIAGMPTDTASDDLPPNIAVVPTTDEALADLAPALRLYATYCAECHGARGEGIDDIPAVNTSAVQSMSRRELRRISFSNAQIEGHDDLITSSEQLALIELMQHGFSGGD